MSTDCCGRCAAPAEPVNVRAVDDGFDEWWAGNRVTQAKNVGGVARMVWAASARYNRRAAIAAAEAQPPSRRPPMGEHEKRLREALGAGPTPGPWWLRTNRHPNTDGTPWGWMDLYPPGTGRQASPEGVQVTWSRGRQSERNADYIAAADPESIRALLSDLDAARAECERLRAGHSTALVALAEARGEVERLTRELASARADAERYQWLRRADGDWGICAFDHGTSEWVRDSRGAAVVDAAIDAARAKEATHG